MKIHVSLMLFAVFSIMLFAGSIDYADALKAKGTGLTPKSFGKATSDIVCGDKLCSEIPMHQTVNIPKTEEPKLVSDFPVATLSNNDTFEMSADMITNTISGKNLEMYGYNGQTPGPLINVKQGDNITVQFTNNINFPTTVHWHGLRLDYTSDGVPEVTQEPIQPGESFEYKLKFPDEGIFLYHPHVRTEMQMEKGLYGNILVESDESIPADYKIPLILDDISIIDDGSLEAFEPDMITKTLMGRFGNTMMINGNADYTLELKQGEIARFYLTSTANTRTFDFGIDQHQLKLVGDDASKYEKEIIADSVIIAPSERRIVDVLFDQAGEFDIIHSTPEKTYILGKISVLPSSTTDNSNFFNVRENPEIIQEIDSFRDFFSQEPDLELEFDLKTTMKIDHAVMSDHGSMAMDKHESKPEPIEWEDGMPQMNAMSNDENTNWIIRDTKTGKEGFDIDYQASVGDITKIRLINSPDSAHPMQHPIHLHGQRFLVLNENGIPNENLAWKDSVLVPTGSTVDILVEFSNPGQWVMHCHILEHAEAGMITEVTVNS